MLHSFNQKTLQYCKRKVLADIGRLNEKMTDRLEWSDVKMLRSLVTFIDTQSWQIPAGSSACSTSEEEGDEVLVEILTAVDYITCFFKQQLEAKDVSMLGLSDEVEEVVEYTRRYLSPHREKYHKVWNKIHTAPDSTRWPNLLLLKQLCFSLPL